MDVTPELIETIDFPEKFRGYDPEEVNKFLEKVGGRIVELTTAVSAAEQRAEEARRGAEEAQRIAAATPAPPPGLSDEEEAAESTRTLMLAKRTADAAIADARAEAQKLRDNAEQESTSAIDAARTESERMLADARTQADDLLRDAAARAEAEFDGRREGIRAEIATLQTTKENVAADVDALESRSGEYRTALETVAGRLTDVLADPELLRERTPLDIDMTPVSTVVETTGHEAAAPEAAAPEPAVEAVFEADVGSAPPPPPPPPVAPAPIFEPSAGDAPLPEPPPVSTDESAHSPFSPAAGPFGPGPLDEATEHAAFTGPEADPATPAAATVDEPAGDPWAPGSWSEIVEPEVAADIPDAASADAVGNQLGVEPHLASPFGAGDLAAATPESPAPAGPPPATGSTFLPDAQFPADGPFTEDSMQDPTPAGDNPDFQVVDMDPEPPTGSFGGLSQDRFLRDLDAAVNSPEEPEDDDAMSAFLMGDDEAQARRFGRRR